MSNDELATVVSACSLHLAAVVMDAVTASTARHDQASAAHERLCETVGTMQELHRALCERAGVGAGETRETE